MDITKDNKNNIITIDFKEKQLKLKQFTSQNKLQKATNIQRLFFESKRKNNSSTQDRYLHNNLIELDNLLDEVLQLFPNEPISEEVKEKLSKKIPEMIQLLNLEQHPLTQNAHSLGLAYACLGQNSKAFQLLRELKQNFWQQDDTYANQWKIMANRYYQKQNFAATAQILEHLERENPDLVSDCTAFLGLAYGFNNQYQKSLKIINNLHFKAISDCEPDLFKLAQHFLKNKESQYTLQILQKLHHNFPQNKNYEFEAAFLYGYHNQLDKALALINEEHKELLKTKKYYEGYVSLAEKFFNQKKYKASIEILEKITITFPEENNKINNIIGLSYAFDGDSKKAIDFFQKNSLEKLEDWQQLLKYYKSWDIVARKFVEEKHYQSAKIIWEKLLQIIRDPEKRREYQRNLDNITNNFN